MVPLPRPLPLVGGEAARSSGASPRLPILAADRQPGLMNALMLVGHPFLIAHHGPPVPHLSTIARLKRELVGGRVVRRRSARKRSTCYAQAHTIRNGTVLYRADSPQMTCRRLLEALDARRSSVASAVYGVVDLESVRRRQQPTRHGINAAAVAAAAATTSSRCLAPLRGLGDAVVGRLHDPQRIG